MNGQQAYQQYKQVQVNTSDQGKLIIMLNQGCIKFLRLARKSMEDNKIQDTNNYLIRAQNIINELRATLNHDKGGQISDNLDQLYEFMNNQLIQANIKKDSTLIDSVEELLIDLLDTWKQLINNKKQNTDQAQINVKG